MYFIYDIFKINKKLNLSNNTTCTLQIAPPATRTQSAGGGRRHATESTAAKINQVFGCF